MNGYERVWAIVGFLLGVLVGVFVTLAAATTAGQEVLPTPRRAIGWAAEHLAQQQDRSRWRYIVADPWAGPDWAAAVCVGLNTAINREPVLYRPTVLANGWMLAVDFGGLVADPVERQKMMAVWDSMAVIEPYFHVPSVNSGLSVPVVASHLPQEQVEVVVAWSDQSNRHGVVPIYRAGFAVWQMLSAFDGKFYQLRGTPVGTARCEKCLGYGKLIYPDTKKVIACDKCSGNLSDEDQWLAKWGLSTAKSAAFRADLRKAQFNSEVLGDVARGVLAVQGFVGRGWISEDSLGKDPTKHPIHSLLPGIDGKQPKDAGELIVEMPSGLHDFLLVNGKGERQDLAILNGEAVRDTTVPAPYRPLLQPAISCIRCHWTKDFQVGEQRFACDGLHPVQNDVQTILAPEGGVDVVAFKDAELSRLAGLYAGSHLFDQSLQLGRARLSVAVRQCTAGLVPNKPQGLSVQEAGLAVTDCYNAYRYSRVDAADALLDLGYVATDFQEPRQELARLLGGAADNPDATILGLLRGLEVRREDWERVYHDAYLRAVQTEGEVSE